MLRHLNARCFEYFLSNFLFVVRIWTIWHYQCWKILFKRYPIIDIDIVWKKYLDISTDTFFECGGYSISFTLLDLKKVFFVLCFELLFCWKIKLFSKSSFKSDSSKFSHNIVSISFCCHNVFNLRQITDTRPGKTLLYYDIITSMFYNLLNIYFFESLTNFLPYSRPSFLSE